MHCYPRPPHRRPCRRGARRLADDRSARSPASPTRSSSTTRAPTTSSCWASPPAASPSPTGWPSGSPRSRAAPVPVGALDVTMYRDDLRLQPARALERTDVPPGGRRRQGRRPRRRRALLRPHGPRRARRAQRPRPAARRPARRPGRPRPPRAADPRRLRRQEPADLAAARPCACCWPSSTAETACCIGDAPDEGRRVKRHLLSAGRPDPRRRAARARHRRGDGRDSADRPIKKLPTLRGRTVVNLFFEDSTRTRISFEAAAKRLSADVINFSAKGSSVSKGECSRTPR